MLAYHLIRSTYVCAPSQMRTELYFLSSQKNRPSLFGMPLIVPCTVHTSKKDLYDAVWIQVSRLASPLPPQEASNHAQDWYPLLLTKNYILKEHYSITEGFICVFLFSSKKYLHIIISD